MAKITRKSTDKERKVFVFLNWLRNTGVTNMFGAAPYITQKFPNIKNREAMQLLSLWMDNFDENCKYDEIEVNEFV